MRLSLRTKLVSSVLLLLIPVLALLFGAVWAEYERQRDAALDQQVQSARFIAALVDTMFDDAIELGGAFAHDPMVRSFNPTLVDPHLEQIAPRYAQYQALAVTNANGDNIGNSVPYAPGAPRASAAQLWFFQQAMATGEPVVSEAYQSVRWPGRPLTVITVPVLDGGRAIGAVHLVFDLNHLPGRLAEVQLEPGAGFTVIDPRGRVAFANLRPDLAWEQRDISQAPEVQAALAGQVVRTDRYRNLAGEVSVAGFVRSARHGWVVGVNSPPAVVFQPIEETFRWALAGFALIALLGIGGAWALAGYLFRPVGQLATLTQAWGRGELERRASVRSHDELEDLGRTFNAMAERIQGAMRDMEASRDEAEAARRRLAFLVEAGAILTASLDYETTLTNVARMATPRLADWCVVDVVENQEIHRVAAVHADPAKEALTCALRRYPPDPNVLAGVTKVLRSGKALLSPEISDAALQAAATGAEHLQILRELGAQSSMVAPLRTRGRILGAISFIRTQSSRRYGPADLDLAEELADRAAAAVDNAQLYHETQRLNAELEQRVVERTAALDTANKELEAFAYSVSHDLRAPLRTIDGFSQALLEDYAGILDEEGKDYLQRVRNASQHMARLIDDLLMLSRVTRSELRRETVDLSALVRSVAAELQGRQPGRQVTLTIAEGLVVQGDGRLLQVALENLLGNAWKFTGKRPDARIEFGATQQDGEPVYFVSDNGVGFDMAYVDKLFGAFQRLHSAAEFEGSGIGLATVQRIIRRHGGRIWAEGAINQGATFSFTVPRGA